MSCNKVILVILDGWGVASAHQGNAIHQANPRYYENLCKTQPFEMLNACGLDVGLPKGVMGNSEVGHMNIGCGRVVEQDQVRINKDIASGELFERPAMQDMMMHSKKHASDIHLLGLVSNGCVHSAEKHYLELIQYIGKHKHQDSRILFHAISDGRDVAPESAKKDLKTLENALNIYGGKVVSLTGRFYAMDRDSRWERTFKAYEAIAKRKSTHRYSKVEDALTEAYTRGESDEFIEPSVICQDSSYALKENDALICFNFRSDRMRQIYGSFLGKNESKGFETVNGFKILSMTRYDQDYEVPVLSAKQNLEMSLGEYLSLQKLKQFRAAETEKYAHVTFFLNAGKEKPFPGEIRKLIPSPKVKTYDQTPGMNALMLTKEVLAQMELGLDFIVVNYAQPDMVGHTGNFEAALEAVKITDSCLEQLGEKAQQKGYGFVLTADHGNIEMMKDLETGKPHTSHTLNPVPMIVIPPKGFPDVQLRSKGALSNIAPTILDLMDLKKPRQMTAESLLK